MLMVSFASQMLKATALHHPQNLIILVRIWSLGVSFITSWRTRNKRKLTSYIAIALGIHFRPNSHHRIHQGGDPRGRSAIPGLVGGSPSLVLQDLVQLKNQLVRELRRVNMNQRRFLTARWGVWRFGGEALGKERWIHEWCGKGWWVLKGKGWTKITGKGWVARQK